MKTKEELLGKIVTLGWECSRMTGDYSDCYLLKRMSPKGIEIKVVVEGDDIVNSIANNFDNYDESYETYTLLNAGGRGPNEELCLLEDVLKEIKKCKSIIQDLFFLLSLN